MCRKKIKGNRKKFEKELISKASKMNNQELKKALLETRMKNRKITNTNTKELTSEEEILLFMEGVYSDELKRRELLEWALQSK